MHTSSLSKQLNYHNIKTKLGTVTDKNYTCTQFQRKKPIYQIMTLMSPKFILTARPLIIHITTLHQYMSNSLTTVLIKVSMSS